MKQGQMRSVQGLSEGTGGQAGLLHPTEKKFIVRFYHCSFQLYCCYYYFLFFFIWWEMWCIHQTMRDGRLVLSGSRRQVLGAAWDNISWEEVCKRQIRHFSARKHLQWTGNLQAARQVFHRISPHSSGTLPAPLTWTWARSCPLTWNVDFGETLWKKVSSSHTLAGT